MAETNWTAGKGTTALGIIGTALGGLAAAGGGGLNLLGGGNGAGNCTGNCTGNYGAQCSENVLVNRYEAGLNAKIAELANEIKLRDSNIYTDNKLLEVYKYFDGELKDVRGVLCNQAVKNQETADAFQMVRNDLICCKNELYSAITRERDERCCADNAIVTYANATFYPKQIADVTVGTTTTAQNVYNPIPNCGRCCN